MFARTGINPMKRALLLLLFCAAPIHPALAAGTIASAAALVAAIRDANEGRPSRWPPARMSWRPRWI
jgi:hypothetical protein